MPEQNLPIKLFSKRTQDERRTPGMGDKKLPPWTLSPEELGIKSTELVKGFSDTANRLRSRATERAFIPAVVQVSIRKEAQAKTHRGKIGELFNRKTNEYNFIGLSDNLELLIKVDSISHFDFINRNLNNPTGFPVGVSAINQIGTFHPEVDVPEDTDSSLKIKLVNFQNRALNSSVESAFEQALDEQKVGFTKTTYAQGMTVYKTQNIGPDSLDEIMEFEGLFSITPMPTYTLDLDEGGTGPQVPVKLPVAGEDYPILGILDSGIAKIPHLAPWVIGRSTAYPDEDVDQAHGTFVAGVALYGDELEAQDWVGKVAYKLFDATVYPRRGVSIDEDDLIRNIQRAVRQNPEIKIWNLSLGTRDECRLDEFSDFGQALDFMQDQFDVLICKSAGNCENYKHNLPKSRIANSADSVRSLVVASMAHMQGPGDFVPEGYPSPFSRIGPAPNNLVKPDITHMGGNAGMLSGGALTYTGVSSFSVSGNVVQNIGTSFSTPRVSALLTGLNHRLAEKFNPLLLKALVIHSAKYPAHLALNAGDRLKEMGYGMPGSLDEIIYNSPHEVTLILSDTVTKGGWTQILDFPFPQELVHEGQYYGEITVTLVTGTWLDSTQGPEYCQSNIEVQLGTYDSIKEHDISKRGVLNSVGTDKLNNLLNPGFYSKRIQSKIDHPFMPERQLRNYNGKFHPIKKFAVDLQELTDTNRSNMLQAPKKWCLQVKGLFMKAAEAAAGETGEVLAQDFALIITIRDPRKQHDVYSLVTRSLEANNFQHSNVKLRNEVQINVRNSISPDEDAAIA